MIPLSFKVSAYFVAVLKFSYTKNGCKLHFSNMHEKFQLAPKKKKSLTKYINHCIIFVCYN